MIRRIIQLVLAAIALTVIAAGPASAANNPGSCSLSAGIVRFNVKEQPTEGSVDYVSIASPVRLDLSTRVDVYLNSTGDYMTGRNVYSAPVDGDGYWNYRADFNIVNTIGDWSGIGRAYITIERYNSTSHCASSVYI